MYSQFEVANQLLKYEYTPKCPSNSIRELCNAKLIDCDGGFRDNIVRVTLK